MTSVRPLVGRAVERARTLALGVLTVIAAVASTAEAGRADEPAEARLIVASVHADWCGSCTLLAPKIAAVAEALEAAPVRFVTLDYTDKDRTSLFAQAEAAGVGEALNAYVEENRGVIATGRVLMVEPISGQRVGLMTAFQSRFEIERAIRGWLGL